jgi:hypothetical protein
VRCLRRHLAAADRHCAIAQGSAGRCTLLDLGNLIVHLQAGYHSQKNRHMKGLLAADTRIEFPLGRFEDVGQGLSAIRVDDEKAERLQVLVVGYPGRGSHQLADLGLGRAGRDQAPGWRRAPRPMRSRCKRPSVLLSGNSDVIADPAALPHPIFVRVVRAEDLADLLGQTPVPGRPRLVAAVLCPPIRTRVLSCWFGHRSSDL